MTQFTPDQRTSNALPGQSRFGALLKQFRAIAGLTQTELADQAGMSWRGIADLERGVRRAPYPSTVRRLAEALALSAQDRAQFIAASGRHPASDIRPALQPSGIRPLPTSLVGREDELSQIEQMLAEWRLVTLTGPPGVGKTRLAYEAARTASDAYTDGAAAVELASLADPVLVPHMIASALGVTPRPNTAIIETVHDVLGDREVLLLLDNCEHLVDAVAALVDNLLRSCSGLRVFATSRMPLQIHGEVLLEVRPLRVPESDRLRSAVEVARSDAVRLFVYRCRMLQPGFSLTDGNAPAVAELCRRLDGLPLALELAAGRIRGLPVDQMISLLDNRFRLLTGGMRTAAPHQQTLLSTLDWSYALLSDVERRVFEAMSVFGCGADSVAVASVCAQPGDVLVPEVVSRLIEHSLVVADKSGEAQVRYRLLENIREYALDRLSESEAEDLVRGRHADAYYHLVVDHAPARGDDDPGWLAQLDQEQANVRAALLWLIRARDGERALMLASAASQFWDRRGYVAEARQRLSEVLDLTVDRVDGVRLAAIVAAAHLARRDDDYDAVEHWVDLGLELEQRIHAPASRARLLDARATARDFRGDSSSARALHEQVVAIWRQMDDISGLPGALINLSISCDRLGDTDASIAGLLECIALARQLTYGRTLSTALNNLGLTYHSVGRDAEARTAAEESLAIARARADVYATANALGTLGLVVHRMGDLGFARQLFEESLLIRRQTGDRRGVGISLQNLAMVLLDLGEPTQAELLLEESLAVFAELGSNWGVADSLETLACVMAALSDGECAWRLLQEAEKVRTELHLERRSALQVLVERWFDRTSP